MKFLDETGLKFIATKFKELRDSLTNKVDKVENKQLSSNDYTNEAKAKVDAIPKDPKYTDTVQDLSGYAKKEDVSLVEKNVDALNRYVTHQDNVKANRTELKTNLSEMTDDSTHRLVTDAEKTAWNNKLDSLSGKDVSRSKTKGYSSAGAWSDVSSSRDVEDWIGDFDKRTRENKKSMESFIQSDKKFSDLKYSTLKNLKPGFYVLNGKSLTTDSGPLKNYDYGGFLLLSPGIEGSLFVGFDFIVPGIWICSQAKDGEAVWFPIIDCRTIYNIEEKLKKLKQQVILTQSQYDALSSTDKNDASKIYFIKG